MVSQELQTISCLLRGRTGGIGKLPTTRPRGIVFLLEDGTRLRLLGFDVCHPSIVTVPGQKKVACFARGKAAGSLISQARWQDLAGSANAVLFTSDGQHCQVEILKQATSWVVRGTGKALVLFFKKTGLTDQFIPCQG